MMFADPLSRVCGPTEGWYDPSLPRKLAALLEHLPNEVRNNINIRVYAGKDTYAAGRLVQKWRKPNNPISQGKLFTKDLAPDAFHIGVDDVNKSVNEIVKLIRDNKRFAVLIPISVTSEIARLENKDVERQHDRDLATKVHRMSKITLASSAEVWLINLPGEPFSHFYSNDVEGLGLTGVQEVFLASYEDAKDQAKIIGVMEEENEPFEASPITRSRRLPENRDKTTEPIMSEREDYSIHTPSSGTIISGNRHTTEVNGSSSVEPVLERGKIRWGTTNTRIRRCEPVDRTSAPS
jgi:hypothetical protein